MFVITTSASAISAIQVRAILFLSKSGLQDEGVLQEHWPRQFKKIR